MLSNYIKMKLIELDNISKEMAKTKNDEEYKNLVWKERRLTSDIAYYALGFYQPELKEEK